MRSPDTSSVRAYVLLLPVIAGCLTILMVAKADDKPVARASDPRFTPYSTDSDHLWNRLHQALFVREADGRRYIHSLDPLLYRGGTFLLEGESHRRALTLLDQFLAIPNERTIDDPLKRLYFQHDLWAAFDYAA